MRPRPHAPTFDLRDERGLAWCTCGLPFINKQAHDLPEIEDDLSDRIAGDHDNDTDTRPGGVTT